MSVKPQFSAGQEIKTDSDIRDAMLVKEPIMVYQDLMRLRPPLPIMAYNDDIIKIADGTTFLRRVTKFYTLSVEEAAVYNSKLK